MNPTGTLRFALRMPCTAPLAGRCRGRFAGGCTLPSPDLAGFAQCARGRLRVVYGRENMLCWFSLL
jgi:hypothetical protein